MNKVYLFNTANDSFQSLPKLTFNHKISGVFYNNFGKALWYVASTKSLYWYNLNVVYPLYDRVIIGSKWESKQKSYFKNNFIDFEDNANWGYWSSMEVKKSVKNIPKIIDKNKPDNNENKLLIEFQDLAYLNTMSVNRETKHSSTFEEALGQTYDKDNFSEILKSEKE